MSSPAVFLDRDGTLNRERGYVTDPAQLEVLPGARQALGLLRDAGWRVVVLTNQAGIAKGLYTPTDLARVHERLHRDLAAIPLGYFHCPHHPDGLVSTGYAGGCACRKPADGLLRRAAEVCGLTLDGSVVVGDSARDLLPARGHGMRTVLVRSGKPWERELATLTEAGATPDAVVDDVLAAARWIVAR